MKIENATVFITGYNRGLGLAFAREALAPGASTVFAGLIAKPPVYLQAVAR